MEGSRKANHICKIKLISKAFKTQLQINASLQGNHQNCVNFFMKSVSHDRLFFAKG